MVLPIEAKLASAVRENLSAFFDILLTGPLNWSRARKIVEIVNLATLASGHALDALQLLIEDVLMPAIPELQL
jgi:predicted ATP-grasp superfamily ATP-dependent carboligase